MFPRFALIDALTEYRSCDVNAAPGDYAFPRFPSPVSLLTYIPDVPVHFAIGSVDFAGQLSVLLFPFFCSTFSFSLPRETGTRGGASRGETQTYAAYARPTTNPPFSRSRSRGDRSRRSSLDRQGSRRPPRARSHGCPAIAGLGRRTSSVTARRDAWTTLAVGQPRNLEPDASMIIFFFSFSYYYPYRVNTSSSLRFSSPVGFLFTP